VYINWTELSIAQSYKLERATEAERFRQLALLLVDAPYRWGQETLRGTDCSGTVCFPLFMMGYDVRVTADVLYRKLFTRPVAEPEEETDPERIMCVFYITRRAIRHGELSVPAGTAIHVTPVVGRYVVVNAGDPVSLETAAHVRRWFEAKQCGAEWRELDRGALQQMHNAHRYLWGADPLMELLRAAEGEEANHPQSLAQRN
jgi:hypothetical protein